MARGEADFVSAFAQGSVIASTGEKKDGKRKQKESINH